MIRPSRTGQKKVTERVGAKHDSVSEQIVHMHDLSVDPHSVSTLNTYQTGEEQGEGRFVRNTPAPRQGFLLNHLRSTAEYSPGIARTPEVGNLPVK